MGILSGLNFSAFTRNGKIHVRISRLPVAKNCAVVCSFFLSAEGNVVARRICGSGKKRATALGNLSAIEARGRKTAALTSRSRRSICLGSGGKARTVGKRIREMGSGEHVYVPNAGSDVYVSRANAQNIKSIYEEKVNH